MIRVLLKSLRQYRWAALVTSIFVIGEVVLEVLIPFFTAALIDAVSEGADMNRIILAGAELLGLAAASLVIGMVAGIASSTASTGFARNLRHDEFYNIQKFSFATMDKFSTSSLVTRMTTDVTNVQMAFMMIIRMAVRAPMVIIFAMVMSFIMAGKLAMIYVWVTIPMAVATFLLIKIALPIFRRVFNRYDKLNESIQENVESMRVVKSYVREKYEIKKFDTAATSLQKEFTKAEKLLALSGPLMNLAVAVIFVCVIYFASQTIIVSQGSVINIGQFSTLFIYGFQILMNLMMLSMVFAMIAMSLESAERIVEVLQAESTIKEPENPIFDIADGSIDFEGVDFSYGKHQELPALHDITFHIKNGETVGIIGGTGAAKSTLVQLIPRLYDVSCGRVLVGGRDVREYDITALRDAVSMVLQKNVLFSGTVAENLRWGNENASDEELIEACKLAQAWEFVEKMPEGLETRITQGGTNVSGGQKQRLCIARALLKHPKVLIFDDSTSAVDTKTDKKIRDGLASFMPDTTKIIIAQRTSSVETADKIIVMDNGTIVEVGTHEELLKTSEIYREVYMSQNKQSHDLKMEGVSKSE